VVLRRPHDARRLAQRLLVEVHLLAEQHGAAHGRQATAAPTQQPCLQATRRDAALLAGHAAGGAFTQAQHVAGVDPVRVGDLRIE
jgi:hypothetical protein